MIINADSFLPQLKEKIRPTQSDDSRHILCPQCTVRTRLNILGDGRRKCTVCGKKFRVHKVTAENKLHQCAEILLCFCLDFSAQTAAQITHHRHKLVVAYYSHFRTLIGQTSFRPTIIDPVGTYIEILQTPRQKSWCIWCKSKMRSGTAGGKTPVFGVQFRDRGDVYLDPLCDAESLQHFQRLISRAEAPGCREGYAGFVCCGKFHRFTEDGRSKESAEQLWTWIRERIRTHHVLWKRNATSYLKELEWKFNNRSLDPDLQAKKFIGLMPMNFLTLWAKKKILPV